MRVQRNLRECSDSRPAPRSQLKVRNIIGIGGTLDMLAGSVGRPSRLADEFGLEWLYRLFQEPERMVERVLRDMVFLARLFFSRT